MITPRLECILSKAHGRISADIGCDHAYISIALIERGISERVIASDVRRGPAETAARHIAQRGIKDAIDVRIGSGLAALAPHEADEAIIAGMGGELIVRLLSEEPETTKTMKRLILQPMNNQHLVRRYLIENGFEITDEDIAVEGFKVYNIITARAGSGVPFDKNIYYHIPYYLKNHRFYTELYNKKHREFTKILSGLQKSNNKDGEMIELYENLLSDLEKYCKEDL